MSEPLAFSVVIPTCDRPDLLAGCLERLAPGRQTLAASDYEVIVTDDGRSAPTKALVERRFPWARWVPGPARGPAANRNHGAGLAVGRWLAFTDDDCEAVPGWLRAWHEARSYRPERVLEGRTLAAGPKPAVDMEAPVNSTGGFLWSCNFAIERELFAAIGGFDSAFVYATMEDVDLRTRLAKRGIGSIFVPEALVWHPWRRRKGRVFLRRHVASVEYFISKHPESAGFFSARMTVRNVLANSRRVTREAWTTGWTGWLRAVGLELFLFGPMMRLALRHNWRQIRGKRSVGAQ